MSTKNNVRLAIAAAALFAGAGALSSDVAAQSIHRSAAFTKRVGSTKANAFLTGRATVYASLPARRAFAQGDVVLGATLLGRTATLDAQIRGDLSASRTAVGAQMRGRVRALGRTLLSRSFGFMRSKTMSYGPYYPLRGGLRYRQWVGPVPVLIRGNIGIGASATLGINGFDARTMTLRPFTRGSIYGIGTASVSVDLWLAGAGIGANLKFGNVRVNGNMTVQPRRVTGSVSASITPVSLRVYLTAYINYFFGRKTWTKNLFTWAMRAISLGTRRF